MGNLFPSRFVAWEPIMKNFILTFINDTSGAAAAEYALILAVVGTGIAGAAFLLGGAIKTAINNATTEITTVRT